MKLQHILDMLSLPNSQYYLAKRDASIIKEIYFISPGITLDSAAAYIGAPKDICNILSNLSVTDKETYTFFSSGTSLPLVTLAQSRNVNLIITDMDLHNLYNRLSALYRKILSFTVRIQHKVLDNCSLSEIILFLKENIQGTIYLLNTGYKCLSSSTDTIQCPDAVYSEIAYKIANDLEQTGFLEPLTIAELKNIKNCYIKPLRTKSQGFGYLLILLPENMPNALSFHYADIACPLVARLLENAAPLRGGIADTTQFIVDLIDRKITTVQELAARQKAIAWPSSPFYSCLVIKQDEPSDFAQSYLVYQAQQHFPQYRIVCHRDSIILVASTSTRTLPFDPNIVEKFLETYNLLGARSYPISNLIMLSAIFQQASIAIHYGKRLDFTSNNTKRLFAYENYAFYHIIDIWRDSAFATNLNKNLGYLCHPAYLALSRHDKANNDNLLEICRTYLNNNMNVAQSAKLLYIHRNTMIRKLELAEEITGRDLNDSHFQHLMWISYQADDYAKNILHCDISSLNL